VEGDSQVIIHLVLKIIHGSHPSKVSPSWRLLGLLEDFRSLLQPNLTLIPSHVKREANKITDHLANEGVASKEEMIQLDARISPAPHYCANVWIYPEATSPPSMGCHIDNMQPKPFMRPVATLAFNSWMEDKFIVLLGRLDSSLMQV
jgi:hypothetical protein